MICLMSKEFRDKVISWLREKFVEILLKKFLGGAVGGVKFWLLKTIIGRIWKKRVRPILFSIYRKIDTFLKKIKYKKKAKALNESKNDDEFDSAADNMP